MNEPGKADSGRTSTSGPDDETPRESGVFVSRVQELGYQQRSRPDDGLLKCRSVSELLGPASSSSRTRSRTLGTRHVEPDDGRGNGFMRRNVEALHRRK